jgi:phosphoserine phosphatase
MNRVTHEGRNSAHVPRRRPPYTSSLIAIILLIPAAVAAAHDPLGSWNDGPVKQAILKFVADATREGPTFIQPAQRIAVFDNDGTLWAEQPMYFQLAFAIDRVKALAPQHPEWKDKEPFKSVLAEDIKTALAGGEKAILEIIMATHAGMTTDEFATIVADWIKTARHPRFRVAYTEMVYRPMLELMTYLRTNGFKTFIVSGGGVEFMRVWTDSVYRIPPEQVVGSTIVTHFEMRDGVPLLLRDPKVDFIDDKDGKPVAINKFIGQRPVFAFGNSDGDLQMLQWTAANPTTHFVGLIHHTDATREWAYDRKSNIGQLDKALDEATAKGWAVVDMKRDWKHVFPFVH